MRMRADMETLFEQLEGGGIIGLPIEQLQQLEIIKDYCFSRIGPLHVGVDMNLEVFILKRDYDLKGDKWY